GAEAASETSARYRKLHRAAHERLLVDPDRLQSVSDLALRHVGDHFTLSDGPRKDHHAVRAGVLLVVLRGSQNARCVKRWKRRRFPIADCRVDPLLNPGGQDPTPDRDCVCRDHSPGHRFAMSETLIAQRRLDSVSDGVAIVEVTSEVLVLLISADD